MDTGFIPVGPPVPPSSPTDDDLDFIRLIRSRRVGPATFHRLMAEHGSARAALLALPEIASKAGISDYTPCPEGVAVGELNAGRRAGAQLIRCDSSHYPQALRDIDGAPPILWLRGDPAWLGSNPVAVIGARNASSLGLRMARGMSAGLGEAGYCVTAGLARGIDTAAHNAALPTGTIAVLAGGVDVIYPPENVVLAAQIAERGALVSEQPPGTEPAARHFPTRNRIISGLSAAVVVIEAAHRSGSLITAKNALDQGREVMAVPGHPLDARAAGCNMLIRDGALLVRGAMDVADALALRNPRVQPIIAPQSPRVAPSPRSAIAPHATATTAETAESLEGRIIARLSPSPTDENDLIRDLGISVATASAAILSLELEGRLMRVAGGRIALN